MEDERKKIKEPFDPKDTPNPPQEIDPDINRKRENPVAEQGRKAGKPDDKKSDKPQMGHLLDEEADINDETTI